MVFGVFDRFHKGHEYFLSQAHTQAEQLVVVVTLPEVVESIKKKAPFDAFEERIGNIKKFNLDFRVVPGDKELGSWQILKDHEPDIIFLGYDQQGIARELDRLNFPYLYIDAHYPEKYKSSLLRPTP